MWVLISIEVILIRPKRWFHDNEAQKGDFLGIKSSSRSWHLCGFEMSLVSNSAGGKLIRPSWCQMPRETLR